MQSCSLPILPRLLPFWASPCHLSIQSNIYQHELSHHRRVSLSQDHPVHPTWHRRHQWDRHRASQAPMSGPWIGYVFFYVFSHLIGVELNSQKLSKLDVCTRKSAHASPCPGSQANGWFPQSVAPEATFCSRREMPHHLEKTLSSYGHQPTSHTASGQAFDSCIRANEHHLEDRLAWCASDEKQRRGQRRKTKGDKKQICLISKDFKCT